MRFAIAFLALLAACRTAAVREEAPQPPPRPGPEGRIAVTASAHGALAILDRTDLRVIRRQISERGAPGVAMPVAHDEARGVFYVGPFDGGLARVESGGGSEGIGVDGGVNGLAISPDGARLAVTGAGLTLVELAPFRAQHVVSLDQPAIAPTWLDARTVLVASGSELALVDATRGQVRTRVPLPGPAQAIVKGKDRVIAVVASPPSLVIFALGGQQMSGCPDCGGAALIAERTVAVPLPAGELAPRQALLTPGENLLVVTSGHPRAGAVAGVDLLDGTVLWTAPGPAGADGVAWLGDDRVIVSGSGAPELAVLDATSGRRVATWPLPPGSAPGGAIAAEPHGTALVLDEATGRVLRVGKDGVVMLSEPLGGGELRAAF